MRPSRARLLEVVNTRTGIIKSVTRVARDALEPELPIIYVATLAHFDFRNANREERMGVGKGMTEEEAVQTAIGEALELYCAAQPDLPSLRKSSFAALNTPAISPQQCVLHSAAQHRERFVAYPPWDENVEVLWLCARDLAQQNQTLVPASMVYLDYIGNSEDVYFADPTSNGLAAGPSLEDAIIAGALELIERDAYMITWLNKLPAPELDLQKVDGLALRIIKYYAHFGIQVRAFQLPTDMCVYCVMALLLDRSGNSPAAIVGLGSSLDPRVALLKSLSEASQNRPGLKRRFQDTSSALDLSEYKDVRMLNDHSAFFFRTERLAEFEFLNRCGEKVQPNALPSFEGHSVIERLRFLTESIHAAGYRLIYSDLTTPDLLDYPIRVVRALIPGLQPISFGYRQDRLGGDRVFQLPVRLGYLYSVHTEDSLNRCPHPLS